jgi:hypothetical protein
VLYTQSQENEELPIFGGDQQQRKAASGQQQQKIVNRLTNAYNTKYNRFNSVNSIDAVPAVWPQDGTSVVPVDMS